MPDNDLQAYVQDDDENEDLAVATYTSSAPPSVKEEANVSRTRNRDKLTREQAGSGSASPAVDLVDDSESDSVARARRSPSKRETKRSKESRDKQRKKEKPEGKKKSLSSERPHTSRARTTPNLDIHTSPSTTRRHPEIAPSPVITAASTLSRPRAYTAQTTPITRPVSFLASPGSSVSRPPISNQRYHTQSAFAPPPPPPPLSPYPSQPPMFLPQPVAVPPFPGHYSQPQNFHHPAFQSPPFQPVPAFGHPQPDYFHSGRPDPRFDYRRPQSAMGHHPSPLSHGNHYEDDYEGGGAVPRRSSVKRRPSIRQDAEDRKTMPPPPRPRRPSTTAATHSPFQPPRTNRRSVGSIHSIRSIDYHESDDESQWSDPEQIHADYRPHAVRRPTIDPIAYDTESRYERSPERQIRNSYYGTPSAERQMAEKFQSAERYQEDRQGPINSLTVDRLQQINRAPSQHTQSATGRGYDNDDAQHILIRGTTRLTIGDVHISMDAEDGAEIRIPATISGGNGTSRGGGSNASDTASYDERRADFNERLDERERRTQADRPRPRSGRATSRAASRTRGLATAAGYYPPPPPTEYSGSGYHYSQPMYAPPSGFPYPKY